MSEENSDSSESTFAQPLDLSGLQGLEFGPRWGAEESKKKAHMPEGSYKPPLRQRDRRPAFKKKPAEFTERRERKIEKKIFKPVIDVLLYPNDSAFKALTIALQTSKITYQLFEIASLILEKPGRFVAVAKVLDNLKVEEGHLTQLFMSVPDHLPFATEEEAVNHVLKNYLDLFLDKQEVEVEAPKGNFTHVSRSLLTGEILGPSNYHKYQNILKNHYHQYGKDMPYEKFLNRIETVKEKEAIDAWLEKMKKEIRYTLKDVPEGQIPPIFESFESARHHLLTHFKDKIVKVTDSVRLPGNAVETLSDGPIKRSILSVFEYQKRFPLETSNNLRGRLRRMNFTLYKKGAKGVSYVSAVKRNFRTPQTVFAPSIQELIEWIEKNPNILKPQLPYLFLGLEAPQVKRKIKTPSIPESEEMETQVAIEEGPPQEEAQPQQQIEYLQEKHLEEIEPFSVVLTPEQEAQFKQILLDLRWLISEGYVIEYSDSKLQAVPILVQGSPKEKKDSKDTLSQESSEVPEPSEDTKNQSEEGPTSEFEQDVFLEKEILELENEGGHAVPSSEEKQD